MTIVGPQGGRVKDTETDREILMTPEEESERERKHDDYGEESKP